jgi:hypothetical protein
VVVVPAGPSVRAALASFPDVEFGPDAAGRIELPRGASGETILWWAEARGARAALTWLEAARDGTPQRADPPAAEWRSVRVVAQQGEPVASGMVLSLGGEPGDWRVTAAAPIGAGGEASCLAGDGLRLLALAPGHAPTLSAENTTGTLRLCPSAPSLTVSVRDPAGDPIGLALVRFHGSGSVPRWAVSDRRGLAVFPWAAAGPGEVSLHSEQHLPCQVAVELSQAAARAQLVADPGALLDGEVRWPDGAPAAGVTVVVRDTTGVLSVLERVASTDARGCFRVAGLEPTGLYAVFASAVRGARTYSAKAVHVQPQMVEVRLTLKDEDPAPPSRTGVHR